jgi:hypothetical protein
MPGDLTLAIVFDYEANANLAKVWCIATSGVRMEANVQKAAERDFAIDVRKIAIDLNWKIEYGPEKMVLKCPH